jgi:hypothetical protein
MYNLSYKKARKKAICQRKFYKVDLQYHRREDWDILFNDQYFFNIKKRVNFFHIKYKLNRFLLLLYLSICSSILTKTAGLRGDGSSC